MNVTKIILDGQVAEIPVGGPSESVDTYTKEEIDQKIAEAISNIKTTLPFEHTTVEKEVGTWFGKKLYAISGTYTIPSGNSPLSKGYPIAFNRFSFSSILNSVKDIIDFKVRLTTTGGIVVIDGYDRLGVQTVTNTNNATVEIPYMSYGIYESNIKPDGSFAIRCSDGANFLNRVTVYCTIYYTKK